MQLKCRWSGYDHSGSSIANAANCAYAVRTRTRERKRRLQAFMAVLCTTGALYYSGAVVDEVGRTRIRAETGIGQARYFASRLFGKDRRRLEQANDNANKNGNGGDDDAQNGDGGQQNGGQKYRYKNKRRYDDDFVSALDDYYADEGFDDDYAQDDYYTEPSDEKQPAYKLFPMDRRDALGFVLASFGVILGSIGGIGGGGIVVPVYIIAMGLPPRVAIPLGAVTVFSASVAGVGINLNRRHPLADRPIIDWDLILVMEPLVLAGALAGTLLHRVFSEKLLMVLLVLLLSVTAHTSLSKAKRMYDAELRYIEHLRAMREDHIARMYSFRSAFRATGWSNEATPGGDQDNTTLSPVRDLQQCRTMSLDSPSGSPNSHHDNTSHCPSKLDADERQRILILNPDFVTLRSDLLEQEKVTPRSKVLALMAKFTVVMFLNMSLGGGAFRSPFDIQCGGVAFWVVHVIMVAFLFSSAWAAQTYLINRHEIKEIIRFDYVQGDIKWEPRTAVVFPLFFICGGVAAGMFGIGGGMITVPLMLAMGVHPSVVTATASTMMFFTGALSASSFALFKLILWDYAAVCAVVGFFSSLIGMGIITRAKKSVTEVHNFERNSIVAYCIGFVIMISALMMTVMYALHIVSYFDEDETGEEVGLCDYRL